MRDDALARGFWTRMDDRTNTIAGWALAGGIAALGLSILTGEYFHAERPEKMGYVVEGVEDDAAAGGGAAVAEKPMEFYMSTADPVKGAEVFKKCAACHNAEKGGANAVGPNLWGAIGKAHGHVPSFTYSDALKSVPGVWDWDTLGAWLKSPKAYAPGTKMTFAGLSKPEDRANVIAYLNQHSDSPLPMPAAPPAGATPAAPAAPGAPTTPAAGGKTAPGGATGAPVVGTVPTPDVAKAMGAKKPAISGEGAPEVSGRAEQRKPK